jgi:hypothetical protein
MTILELDLNKHELHIIVPTWNKRDVADDLCLKALVAEVAHLPGGPRLDENGGLYWLSDWTPPRGTP